MEIAGPERRRASALPLGSLVFNTGAKPQGAQAARQGQVRSRRPGGRALDTGPAAQPAFLLASRIKRGHRRVAASRHFTNGAFVASIDLEYERPALNLLVTQVVMLKRFVSNGYVVSRPYSHEFNKLIEKCRADVESTAYFIKRVREIIMLGFVFFIIGVVACSH